MKVLLLLMCLVMVTICVGQSSNPLKPDLSGTWTGNLGNVFQVPGLRRSGAFEADQSSMQRGAQWNKPMYKPEFWEKVRSLDYGKVDVDPYYGCYKPLGVRSHLDADELEPLSPRVEVPEDGGRPDAPRHDAARVDATDARRLAIDLGVVSGKLFHHRG